MDEFKLQFKTQFITGILKSLRPPPRNWPIPSFMLTMPAMLQQFMGEKTYAIYQKLSSDDQQLALHYIETCGEEIAGLLKCPIWEDWNEKPFKINLENIKKEDPKLYESIMSGSIKV